MATPPFDLTISAPAAAKPYVARLKRLLKKAHPLCGGSVRELSLAIVTDAKMARLHQDYMGIAGPTDVLTFELDHDAEGRVTAGEVVVNLAEARRRSREQRVPLQDELLLYALHGLLHLSSYDDTTKTAYQKMHATEDEILTKLGVGRVFARHPAAPGARGGNRR